MSSDGAEAIRPSTRSDLEVDALLLRIYKGVRVSGGSGKGGGAPPRFNFGPLSQQIFHGVQNNEMVPLFIHLLRRLRPFTADPSHSVIFPESPTGPVIPVSTQHVLVQVMMEQLRASASAHNKTLREKKAQHYKKGTGKKFEEPPLPALMPTVEEAKELVRLIAPLVLPPEAKLWKSMPFFMGMRRAPDEFGLLLATLVKEGKASFCAVSLCMHDPNFSKFLDDPDVIAKAFFLGPLRATTIEQLCAHRSAEFRERAIHVVEAVAAVCGCPFLDASKYDVAWPPCVDAAVLAETRKFWSERSVADNVEQCYTELRGEPPLDTLIHVGWGCAAIKKYAKKTYVDNTWKYENLHELIWTVVQQRPQLKHSAVQTLSLHKDEDAASFWRRTNPLHIHPTNIKGGIGRGLRADTETDPLAPTDDFLNFPPCVKTVEMVRTPKELNRVSDVLEAAAAREGGGIVGLDAEWSAYHSHSKASILQVAVREHVFLIDLDSPDLPPDELRAFLQHMFSDPRLCKIGFMFHEDLQQLRAAVRDCRALFQPDNLICIGKLVQELFKRTAVRKDVDEICSQIVHASSSGVDLNETNGEGGEGEGGGGGELDESTHEADTSNGEVDTSQLSDEAKERNKFANNVMGYGLSKVCERILGRPLDKTEQCSVWTRRPLRQLQMRYAAMDAYCMLMLWDRCSEWAGLIGADLGELAREQEPIRVSLPLFFEH